MSLSTALQAPCCRDFVADQEIEHILARTYENNQMLVDKLIGKALDNGGGDNVTIALISAPQQHTALDQIQGALLHTPLAPLVANAREKRVLYVLMMALLGVSILALWQFR